MEIDYFYYENTHMNMYQNQCIYKYCEDFISFLYLDCTMGGKFACFRIVSECETVSGHVRLWWNVLV